MLSFPHIVIVTHNFDSTSMLTVVTVSLTDEVVNSTYNFLSVNVQRTNKCVSVLRACVRRVWMCYIGDKNDTFTFYAQYYMYFHKISTLHLFQLMIDHLNWNVNAV